jgi:hypothetical protein
MWNRGSASRYRSAAVRAKFAITVRLAVITLAWVRTAPRGTRSTAAVEIEAKGSSPPISAAAGAAPGWYRPASGAKPPAADSPKR